VFILSLLICDLNTVLAYILPTCKEYHRIVTNLTGTEIYGIIRHCQQYAQLPMIVPGTYKRLAEDFPFISNEQTIELCQFLLDTEQVTDKYKQTVTRLLEEGFLYHVPIT